MVVKHVLENISEARAMDTLSGRPALPRLASSHRMSPLSQRVLIPVLDLSRRFTGMPVAHCQVMSGMSTPEWIAFSSVPASLAFTSRSSGRPAASRRNSTSHGPSRPMSCTSRTEAS